MSEIVKKRSPIFNPPKAISRQCPLPSRASSIDLEHPESFMKPDHATSDSASAGLACSLRGPVRSFLLFYTRHGGPRQVLPEMGSGAPLPRNGRSALFWPRPHEQVADCARR